MTAASQPLVLLDEELAAVLDAAPGDPWLPLPWLDQLDPLNAPDRSDPLDASDPAEPLPHRRRAVAIAVGARSLQVRGLAVLDEHGRLSAPPLLAALAAAPARIRVVRRPVDGGQPDVLVQLAPLPDGGLLRHATSSDGVHLLEVLPGHEAVARLVDELDPLGAAPERTAPADQAAPPGLAIQVAALRPGVPPAPVELACGPDGVTRDGRPVPDLALLATALLASLSR